MFEEVCRALPVFGESIILLLAGRGRNKDRVLQMLKDAGIKAVDFGFVENRALPDLLQHIHAGFIFRKPGAEDSIPVVLYEFAALKLPVICNNIGIMGRFAEEKRLGWIVNSAGELESLLGRILIEPETALKSAAPAEAVRASFSRQASAGIFHDWVTEFLQHGPPGRKTSPDQ